MNTNQHSTGGTGMSNEHCLTGKTITSIEIADDRKALRFMTTDGEVIAKADGDCCSDTWVENVEVSVREFPATVLSAEDIALGSDEEVEYGLIAHYGFKIETDKGHIVIDYRNESNGYYGGNLSWPNDGYFYGGVFGQNISNEEWKPL